MLARSLRLAVVTEGIEDEATLEAVRRPAGELLIAV